MNRRKKICINQIHLILSSKYTFTLTILWLKNNDYNNEELIKVGLFFELLKSLVYPYKDGISTFRC